MSSEVSFYNAPLALPTCSREQLETCHKVGNLPTYCTKEIAAKKDVILGAARSLIFTVTEGATLVFRDFIILGQLEIVLEETHTPAASAMSEQVQAVSNNTKIFVRTLFLAGKLKVSDKIEIKFQKLVVARSMDQFTADVAQNLASYVAPTYSTNVSNLPNLINPMDTFDFYASTPPLKLAHVLRKLLVDKKV